MTEGSPISGNFHMCDDSTWHVVKNLRNALYIIYIHSWPGTSEAARWRKKQKQNPGGSVPSWELDRVHTSSKLGMQESSKMHNKFCFECNLLLWHLTLFSSFLEVQTSSCLFRTTGLLDELTGPWLCLTLLPFFTSLRQLGMLWTLIQFCSALID